MKFTLSRSIVIKSKFYLQQILSLTNALKPKFHPIVYSPSPSIIEGTII